MQYIHCVVWDNNLGMYDLLLNVTGDRLSDRAEGAKYVLIIFLPLLCPMC